MKTNVIWALSLFAGVLQLMAQETYSVMQPYDFPIKPATQAWANLTDYADKIASCELPISTAKTMSTQALLQTCLKWPMRGDIMAYPDSAELRDHFFNNFYGMKALAARKDAGACLIDFYHTFSDDLARTNHVSIIELTYIHWLYTRPEITATFTPEQKEQLTILSFRSAVYIYAMPDDTNLSIVPAKNGLCFMVNDNISIHHNNTILDKSMLPADALTFVNGGSSMSREWFGSFITFIEPFVK
jgi:hypothetical protein